MVWVFRPAGSVFSFGGGRSCVGLVVVCIYVTRLVFVVFFGAEAFVVSLSSPAVGFCRFPRRPRFPSFSVPLLFIFFFQFELLTLLSVQPSIYYGVFSLSLFLCIGGGHRRRSGRGSPPCASLLCDPP